MPELIDRQSALSVCKEYCWLDDEDFIEGYNTAIKDMREAIKELPTIEAEPVRRGRMIEGRYPNDNKCSECGQTFRDDIGFIIQDNHGEFHYPKRCPECGCYWDGGDDNA
jgi:hypothetical protein